MSYLVRDLKTLGRVGQVCSAFSNASKPYFGGNNFIFFLFPALSPLGLLFIISISYLGEVYVVTSPRNRRKVEELTEEGPVGQTVFESAYLAVDNQDGTLVVLDDISYNTSLRKISVEGMNDKCNIFKFPFLCMPLLDSNGNEGLVSTIVPRHLNYGHSVDGPVVLAKIQAHNCCAVALDGSIYLCQDKKIRKVSQDGRGV